MAEAKDRPVRILVFFLPPFSLRMEVNDVTVKEEEEEAGELKLGTRPLAGREKMSVVK